LLSRVRITSIFRYFGAHLLNCLMFFNARCRDSTLDINICYKRVFIMSKYNNSFVDKAKSEKFVLRLPEGMRTKISELSQDNLRSMNSQIVFVLQEYIAREEALSKGKERPEIVGR